MKVASDAAPLFVLNTHQLTGENAQIREHLLALRIEERPRDLIRDAGRKADFVRLPHARGGELLGRYHPGEFARAPDARGEDGAGALKRYPRTHHLIEPGVV